MQRLAADRGTTCLKNCMTFVSNKHKSVWCLGGFAYMSHRVVTRCFSLACVRVACMKTAVFFTTATFAYMLTCINVCPPSSGPPLLSILRAVDRSAS
jgi:hypothetical protein